MRAKSFIAGSAMALAFPAALSAAQPTEQPDPDAAIVVEAPRTVAPQTPPPPPSQRSAYTSAPVVTTTVKISALYGDLDLAQPEHAARLMTRIERVARDACSYLDRLLPMTPDPECVARAVALSTPAAQAAVAAARRK